MFPFTEDIMRVPPFLKRAAGVVWGCGVAWALSATAATQYAPKKDVPTFSKDVAPILYRNCTTCHRPGEIAPMSLLTYREARPWARAIREEVRGGTMPPWHAAPEHGRFKNERRLSDAERDIITRWVGGGAPEGNPSDLPPAPAYVEGWTFQPDLVLSMQEDYPIPAEGEVDYKYFEVPTNFTEDKWVQAVEVRPGDRAVVHHVIVYSRPPEPVRRPAAFRQAEELTKVPEGETGSGKMRPGNDRPAPERLGSFLAGAAPGQMARILDPDTAILVKAGSTLVVQMHYTTNEKATTDRTRLGLKFAPAPPKHEVRLASIVNTTLRIPPGARDYRVDTEATVASDVLLWSMLPHTHLRGTRWEYRVVYPDGRSETILSIPKYDFNWQTDYIFAEPLRLPKGTKIHASAWYDNSSAKESNPDPTIEVRWGDQTWEEMMFTGMTYTLDGPAQTSTALGDASPGQRRP